MAKQPQKKPETASVTLPGGTKVTGPKSAIEKLTKKSAAAKPAAKPSEQQDK